MVFNGFCLIILKNVDSLLIQLETILTRNLSHSASNPSFSAGNSLLAAIKAFIGSRMILRPFWKIFSLIAVSKAFWIEGPAFHISSRKTTSAVGRKPSTTRSYLSSFFKREIDTGPNISSGVLKRDIRYSNDFPPRKISFNLLATRLFAVPGGPNKNILSPATAHSNDIAKMCCFS